MNKKALFILILTPALCAKDNSKKKNAKRLKEWKNNGVTFVRPKFVLIDSDVAIGPGTNIGCGVHLLNGTVVGANCIVEPFCIIDNCVIEDNVTVYSHTVLQDTTVESGAKVGPFARIRKGSTIKSEAEVGNFVEMSASTIGIKSKAKHLTYLGCAQVEEEVNIGAGTITCNYDGYGKHTTVFKCKSFIGSNSTFVAPIVVGEGAVAAAGSAFTQDIPDNALEIGRAHQTNKDGYAIGLKEKLKERAGK